MKMRRFRFSLVVAVLVSAIASVALASTEASAATGDQVVVPRGQPVQIAFVGSSDFPDFTHDIRNGVEMAIAQHPLIRGFSIQLNESDPPCFSGPDPAVANIAVATAIVSDPRNTAVVGHLCSQAFAPALPIYEAAGIVTISGSASNSSLPALGPSVFNRTIVVSDAVGDPGDIWLSQISTLPSDLAFQQDYELEFGAPPLMFTDLYFDAATLLLARLQQVSRIGDGRLVIDRAALAQAVRNTTKFQGVTCTVTLDPKTGNRVNDAMALSRCAEG
jgi:ABC-type branched-subunit amino acid transport system substrate-binding protein